LLKGAPSPRQTMFYYRGTRLYAVRSGRWKLHLQTQDGYGQPGPTVPDRPLLFDLATDPSERFDVGADHPEVIAGIQREIEAHRATVTPVESQLESVVAPSEAAKPGSSAKP
jgi:arylsulfatase A